MQQWCQHPAWRCKILLIFRKTGGPTQLAPPVGCPATPGAAQMPQRDPCAQVAQHAHTAVLGVLVACVSVRTCVCDRVIVISALMCGSVVSRHASRVDFFRGQRQARRLRPAPPHREGWATAAGGGREILDPVLELLLQSTVYTHPTRDDGVYGSIIVVRATAIDHARAAAACVGAAVGAVSALSSMTARVQGAGTLPANGRTAAPPPSGVCS